MMILPFALAALASVSSVFSLATRQAGPDPFGDFMSGPQTGGDGIYRLFQIK